MRPARMIRVLPLFLIGLLLALPGQVATGTLAETGPSVPSRRPLWNADSDQEFAQFGESVASAGDVNGDGFDDVIVGALYYDNGHSDEGRAFAYHGSASGLSLTASWTAEGDQAIAHFGDALGAAGDVNGDGFGDVIVGGYGFHNRAGRAFVYQGTASGLALTHAWTAAGDQASARFGYSVGTAGDVNGDGFDDVIVGAWLYDNGETDEGMAFVYHGSASGLSLMPAWTAEGDQVEAFFGITVSTAGDVNGDGFGDVIVGAGGYSNGQSDEGRAYTYHGSASGLSLTPAWTAESNQFGANFGGTVGTAGDVNGDGFGDVIVGARNYDNGQSDEGRAYTYHGSASGLSLTPAWTAESNQVGANFGKSVGTGGDENGDGFEDVIVGAYRYDNGQVDEGRSFAYHGSASGLSLTPAWIAESNQVAAKFGEWASTAGDVDGNGLDEVIVGASLYDHGEIDEGGAFVYGRRSGL